MSKAKMVYFAVLGLGILGLYGNLYGRLAGIEFQGPFALLNHSVWKSISLLLLPATLFSAVLNPAGKRSWKVFPSSNIWVNSFVWVFIVGSVFSALYIAVIE